MYLLLMPTQLNCFRMLVLIITIQCLIMMKLLLSVKIVTPTLLKTAVMAGQAHSASVVLGTKVTPYAGVEAFYQLSKKEHKANYRSQIQAYGADVLGYLPLGCYGEYEVLASAGLGQYTAKYNKDQDSGLGYRLGAGLQYNVTDNWAVRAMYRHVWVDKSILNSINEFSLGVRYSF